MGRDERKPRLAGFYKEGRRWAFALLGAGALTVAMPYIFEGRPDAQTQCETAVSVEARLGGEEARTARQEQVYQDALRELDECMR